MQKLTAIWQNLMASAPRDQDAGNRNLERLERVSEAFQNQYWSRVISLQKPDQEFAKYAMTDDVVEALHELDELSHWESLGHKVFFDPRKFLQENPEPVMEEYRCSNDDLRHWARRCSWVRQEIKEKI